MNNTRKHTVTLLRGDGIGPEIVECTLEVLAAAQERFGFEIDYKTALIGGAAIDECDNPLPDETVKTCIESDAVLLGAVGGYKWDNLPGDKRPEAGLLGIRSALKLYANLRPAIIYDALKDASPLKNEIIGDALNIMVVRELTGGIYFGEKGRRDDAAYDTEIYTVSEIERIARTAFEIAAARNGRLTSVDKANVMESSRLWRETVTRVHDDYPYIDLTHMYVDNAAMQLVRNPSQFDTIVTSNMFGDILSDEAAMVSGSIGMLPSASVSQGNFGLYEPVHGSAPDLVGTGLANPLATILSAAMMLRYSLNETDAANAIESAVEQTIQTLRTADIYTESDGIKKVTCAEMGTAVAKLVKKAL